MGAVLLQWQPGESRTILLGLAFEIYSDQNSLKNLFTRKVLSQCILRLCEFLADYNFTEIKHVPGLENVVPNFLLCPWDKTIEPSPIHMLVLRPQTGCPRYILYNAVMTHQ